MTSISEQPKYFLVRLDLIAAIEICFCIECICWMAIYLLHWVNKKLRRLIFDDRILLSHRYQVIFIKHEKNIFLNLR